MSLPYKVLTEIKGNKTTDYAPEYETTPEFMNGKFNELLKNDIELDKQINVLNNDRGYLTTKRLDTDANDFVDNGKYTGRGKNFPDDDFWNIDVTKHNDSFITQIAVKFASSNGFESEQCVKFRSKMLGVWQPWEKIATTVKTSFLCSAQPGYTIVEQNCYTLNGIAYINVAVKKNDGSVFESTQHHLFTSPYYSTSFYYPISVVFTSGPLVGGLFNNGAIWTDGGCYITLINTTATQINIHAEVPI